MSVDLMLFWGWWYATTGVMLWGAGYVSDRIRKRPLLSPSSTLTVLAGCILIWPVLLVMIWRRGSAVHE